VTFDGKVFDFAADCEYLLARDFHNEKFTISAVFARHRSDVVLKTIKIDSSGHRFEMDRKGTLKVDGQRQELPWQKFNGFDGTAAVTVTRKESYTTFRTKDKLKVRCDWYYHTCIVSLPAHYHGKSQGLLGSNDNEPSNDFSTPEGTPVLDVDSFARSWHMGSDGSCDRKTNVAHSQRHPKTHQHNALCAKFFRNRNSPFRACFSTVSPVPFLKMCEMDVHMTHSPEVACNISAVYVQMCRFNAIKLDQASECIKCITPSGVLTEGQDVRVAQGPKAADLVLVVEERPCKPADKSELLSFARGVASKLGRRDVRFGVVGFNGFGVHRKPHVHTGNGAVVMDLSGVERSISSLMFRRQSIINATRVDAMEAMHFVAKNFPFRAAVDKIVVLFTCSDCKRGNVGYYELQNELLNNGITFHMLTTADIEMSPKSRPKVRGFDARAMYTDRAVAKTQMRSELVAPHDSCTILAQETDGTVFTSSKGAHGVRALKSLVASKVKPAGCQVCECRVGSCGCSISPKTVCYPCEIPRPVSLTGGGKSFFNIPYLKLKPASMSWSDVLF
jgi:hypothetical protein